MSYCRFSDCDVYVYDDVAGGITIMTHADGDYREETRSAAIAQLKRLRDMGLDVPDDAIDEIKANLDDYGETEGIEAPKGEKQ